MWYRHSRKQPPLRRPVVLRSGRRLVHLVARHSKKPLSAAHRRIIRPRKSESSGFGAHCINCGRRLHGLLQLASNRKRLAHATYAQDPHLPFFRTLFVGTLPPAVALQQSAIRRFLQWLGARKLPPHLERCMARLTGKNQSWRPHIFLVGRCPSCARSAIRSPRRQNAFAASHYCYRCSRRLLRDLVIRALCRAIHLRNCRPAGAVHSSPSHHKSRQLAARPLALPRRHPLTPHRNNLLSSAPSVRPSRLDHARRPQSEPRYKTNFRTSPVNTSSSSATNQITTFTTNGSTTAPTSTPLKSCGPANSTKPKTQDSSPISKTEPFGSSNPTMTTPN